MNGMTELVDQDAVRMTVWIRIGAHVIVVETGGSDSSQTG